MSDLGVITKPQTAPQRCPSYTFNPSATHTVLGIPELVQFIVDGLKDDPPTLARLARVASRFNLPAIKHLWSRSQLGLTNLLSMLPHKKAMVSPYNILCRIMIPAESDWIRVQHYSVHITTIDLTATDYLPSPSAIILLGQRNSLHNGGLFPQLEELQVRGVNVRSYPSSDWILLAGPSLRTLVVQGYPNNEARGVDDHHNLETAFTSLFRHLVQRTPQLRNLTLDNFPDTDSELSNALNTLLCNTLQSFTSLQTFWFRGSQHLPAQFASLMVMHPTLSALKLGPITGRFAGQGIGRQSSGSLVTLDIYGRAISVGEVVRVIPCPYLLTTLRLFLIDDDPVSSEVFLPFHTLFHTVPHLTSFRLAGEEPTFTWEEFRPLLNIQSITSFAIDPYVTGLNDAALADMASAWGNLCTLILPQNERSPTTFRYQITLLGLIPLAKFCPSLKILDIKFTTRINQAQGVASLEGDMQGRLSSLHVGYSEINTGDDSGDFLGPQRTLDFLTTLWPVLEAIFAQWEVRGEEGAGNPVSVDTIMAERWADVSELLEASHSSSQADVQNMDASGTP